MIRNSNISQNRKTWKEDASTQGKSLNKIENHFRNEG